MVRSSAEPLARAPETVAGEPQACHSARQAGSSVSTPADDRRWMELALDEARRAERADEVPIGAVVVRDGEVLGRGHNQTRRRRDATAHAELVALRMAFEATGDARLPGATVYTTVEPCFMCAGALSHARVARVVWGVRDEKFGGCASLGNVLGDPRLNHRAEVTEGVGADEARELLQRFFQNKRRESKDRES